MYLLHAYVNASSIFSCLFLLLLSVRLFNVVTNLFSTFLDPPSLVDLILKSTSYKSYIKFVVDINLRAKIIKLLKENI